MKRFILSCNTYGMPYGPDYLVVDMTAGFAQTILRRMDKVEKSPDMELQSLMYWSTQGQFVTCLPGMARTEDERTGYQLGDLIFDIAGNVTAVCDPSEFRIPHRFVWPTEHEQMQAIEGAVRWLALDGSGEEEVPTTLESGYTFREHIGEAFEEEDEDE